MKPLIITQVIDPNHIILGFFTKWVDLFQPCEVIAQQSETMRSLGKEKGYSLFRQISIFYWYISTLEYDVVFVHMTPIWVVIGFPVFLIRRKPVFLWYESRGTSLTLRIALVMVRKVFSASAYGMPIKTTKSIITGHGIDTDTFLPSAHRPIELITVGRNTPAKNISVLVRCAKKLGKDLDIIDNCHHSLLPQILSKASIFLHASTTGLDKAPLEAMSCGCVVVSSSPAFKNILPPECLCTNDTMADVVEKLDVDIMRAKMREIVVENHSLHGLIIKLRYCMISVL